MIALTIAVPAYRRPDLLRLCLESVRRAEHLASRDGFKLELLVCDDSANGVNSPVYADYPSVRVETNPVNLGIDRNIKRCFDLALGQYCLVIGEDDLLEAEPLLELLRALEGGQHQVWLANYVYCDDSFSKDLGPPVMDRLSQKSCQAAFNRNSKLVSRADLLTEFFLLGFVGSVVFKTSAWREQSHTMMVGTYFHHLSVFGALAFKSTAPVPLFYKTLVRNRAQSAESATWVGQSLQVHTGYYEALREFYPLLDEDEKTTLETNSHQLFRPNNLYWLAVKRAQGAYSIAEFKRYHTALPLTQRTVCWLLSIFPVSVMRMVYLVFARLRRV